MKVTRIALVAGLLTLGGMVTVPAQAGGGHHCVVRLQPVAPRDARGVIRARAVDMGCFASFAQALAVGSGGAIKVSTGTTPAGLTQRQLNASTSVVPDASVMIGTEFDGLSYSGSSNSWFAPTQCAGDDIWEANYVGDLWNDRFQSGKGFGGCDHNRKFGAADFTGSSILCTPNCLDYGVLDNKISSLRWKP
jgi:hypothetical protein